MSHLLPTISGFADALRAALDLHELFWRAHVAVVLDRTGAVVDLTPRFADHSVEGAIEWAVDLAATDRHATSALLLSAVGDDSVLALREADIARFHLARHHLATAGLELRDWILTNGSDLRSMGFSCSTDDPWS